MFGEIIYIYIIRTAVTLGYYSAGCFCMRKREHDDRKGRNICLVDSNFEVVFFVFLTKNTFFKLSISGGQGTDTLGKGLKSGGTGYMRVSRNFRQGGGGGPGQSDNGFFFLFLVLSLFYRSQMVNFKQIYHFSRFQRGSNIYRGGGPNFFQGGGGG